MSRAWFVTRPVADEPDVELVRLREAVDRLRVDVDQMLTRVSPGDAEQREVLEAYRMFRPLPRLDAAGWRRISRAGSAPRPPWKRNNPPPAPGWRPSPTPICASGCTILDDLSNRLLRLLTGQGTDTGAQMPADPILVARKHRSGGAARLRAAAQGRGAGGRIRRVSCHRRRPRAGHSAGHQRRAHHHRGAERGFHPRGRRPGASSICAPRTPSPRPSATSSPMQAEAQERYASIRDKPAEALCGTVVSLQMNAGLMADLPSAALLGGRRGGAVPDRASVPDPQQGAAPGRAGRALCPG